MVHISSQGSVDRSRNAELIPWTGAEFQETHRQAATEEPLRTGPRHLPAQKTKRKFTILGMVPSLFGRVGVSLAVIGAMVGALLGSPEASTRAPGPPPTAIVAPVGETRTGTQVADAEQVFATVTRLIAPHGIDQRQLLDAIGHISFSVQLENGPRITADLTRDALSLNARPSLAWPVEWFPDPQIERLTYDFARAEFRADASGLGPDGIYENLVTSTANQELLPRLPHAMRQPGYDPFTDPNLDQNIQALIDVVSRTGNPRAGSGAGVSSPHVSFDLHVPRDLSFPIPGGETHAFISQGTRVDFSFNSTGRLSDPTLESLNIRFSQPVVIGKGEERPRGFAKIDLHGITLHSGAQVELDYELGPEQAVDGIRALFALVAIAADRRAVQHVGSFERTRMERMRGQIQTDIDNKVEPALADFLRRSEGNVPGFSLLRFFGIAAPTQPT